MKNTALLFGCLLAVNTCFSKTIFATENTLEIKHFVDTKTYTLISSFEHRETNLDPIDSHVKSLKACEGELILLNNNYDWHNDRYCSKYKSWLQRYEFEIEEIKKLAPDYDLESYVINQNKWRALFDESAYPVSESEMGKAEFEKVINQKAYLLDKLIDDRFGSGGDWVFSYFNTSDYLVKVKEADYTELVKIAIEGDSKFPDHVVAYKVKKIKGFEVQYGVFYTETLESAINELIESAYSNKLTNGQNAVKYITKAKELIDAAQLILPKNERVNSLNQETKTAYNSIRESVFGEIFTSDFHKENSGDIVFFSEIPEIKSENRSTVKEKYKAGEFIYAMAYLEGSFKELAEATNDIMVSTTIFVDGAEKTTHAFKMKWAYLKEGNTYLFMEIVPDPTTSKHSGPAKFAKALATVSPREHTVKVVLSGLQVGSSFVRYFAEGQFKLDCTSGQSNLMEYALKYREKNLADVYMPQAKMNNSGLVTSLKETLINEGWEKGKKVSQVVITSNDWEIHRDRVTNKIVSRTISAAAAFETDQDGCKYWNLTFKQLYNGTSYGKSSVSGVGSIVELSCANAK
ncbi:MAG: hypothetical protein HRT58_10380 [Crocinitomicaceae bacterium]|nr:hypothetical protein [Flavobacteriales bacterium]NQZ36061.1 hypothetical protein [Crocinitomicaceae bacterium]